MSLTENITRERMAFVMASHGWPEWPPTERPASDEWWKNENSILPAPWPRLPNRTFVAIDGLPDTGKSTQMDLAAEQGGIAGFPVETIDSDSLYVTGAGDISHLDLSLLFDPDPRNDDTLHSQLKKMIGFTLFTSKLSKIGIGAYN